MTRSHEEHGLQCQFIAAARQVPGCEWIFAIPNAVPGGVRTQMWMNREGRKAGVLDVFNPRCSICPPRALPGIYFGLFMETKIPAMVVNGKKQKQTELTKEQAEFIIHADSVGYAVAVYRSVQQGLDILLAYMRGEHSNDAAVAEAKRKLKI